jgi:hypothetical protein
MAIARRVNTFGLGAAWQNRRFHPILYSMLAARPYIAVNELELVASRRFGRDSFQTRSTS